MIYLCDNKRHLVCVPYSIDNLHKMAEDLGLKRCWYHPSNNPHYDIPKTRVDEMQEKCYLTRPQTLLQVIQGKVDESKFYAYIEGKVK